MGITTQVASRLCCRSSRDEVQADVIVLWDPIKDIGVLRHSRWAVCLWEYGDHRPGREAALHGAAETGRSRVAEVIQGARFEDRRGGFHGCKHPGQQVVAA
mgnify:CR=1 FL=1